MARGECWGNLQLQVLRLLAKEKSLAYWQIIKRVCGEKYTDTCKTDVTRAIRSLRKKKFVKRRRYLGEVIYSLTPEAKRWLLDFCTE
jgi:DNA-binding PadR family transcriptional regulator